MPLIHFFDPEHKYYVKSKEAVLGPRGKLPVYRPDHAARTYVAPTLPPTAGYWPVWDRDTQTWNEVEDWRDKTVYSKNTGQPVKIVLGKQRYPALGPLPSWATPTPKPDGDYIWDDQSDTWVEDTQAIAERTHFDELRAAAFLQNIEDQLRGRSLAQIESWLDTNLAGVPAPVKLILKGLVVRWALKVRQ